MFAKHSPPARRKNIAATAERSKRKKGEATRERRGGEADSDASEVRKPTQIQPAVEKMTTGSNNEGVDNPDSESGQGKGEQLCLISTPDHNGVSGGRKSSEEAAVIGKSKETKADWNKVGKLSATMYRPFGTRSRSASLSGSEGAICKGGPNGSCGNEVVDTDEAMQCDRCDRWYHCACQGVPLSTYQVAVKHEELMWLCKECKASFQASTPTRGHKPQGDEMGKLKESFQMLMQTTMEQLQSMKEMLKEQYLEGLHQQYKDQGEQHKSSEEDRFQLVQNAIDAQKASLDASKIEQLELANQIKGEQKQLIKLVQDQGQLIQSLLKDSETK